MLESNNETHEGQSLPSEEATDEQPIQSPPIQQAKQMALFSNRQLIAIGLFVITLVVGILFYTNRCDEEITSTHVSPREVSRTIAQYEMQGWKLDDSIFTDKGHHDWHEISPLTGDCLLWFKRCKK